MAIAVGDTFPDITLPDADGNVVRIADHRGKNSVVLFFYPKDHTPGCIAEVCTFRDQFQDFVDAGAVVLGVSSDSGKSHQSFQQKYDLPFPLLTDAGGKVRKQLGIKRTLGIIPGRETYVIDRDGIVVKVFNDAGGPIHVKEALEALGQPSTA